MSAGEGERDSRPPASEPEDDPLSAAQAERDAYLDALRRARAELLNYRRRMLREQTRHLERANTDLLRRLLPALDALELAEAHHPEVVGPLRRAFVDILEAEGLERFDPTGRPFDPAEHEAVEHVGRQAATPADSGAGLARPEAVRYEPRPGAVMVEDVLRPGYRFKGRLLRPAAVRVRDA